MAKKKEKKAANSAPVSAILTTTAMPSELFPERTALFERSSRGF